jgi:hypothetical protein
VEEAEETETAVGTGAASVMGEDLVGFDWTAIRSDEERRGAQGREPMAG